MNYKYQGVLPPMVVFSNVDEIKDIEISHVDMSEFIERTENNL